MDLASFGSRGRYKFLCKVPAERIGEANMRDNPLAEKSAGPQGGSVDELIRDHNVAGCNLLA
jgi:hypothetical protein